MPTLPSDSVTPKNNSGIRTGAEEELEKYLEIDYERRQWIKVFSSTVNPTSR